jgi:hypothetical protein
MGFADLIKVANLMFLLENISGLIMKGILQNIKRYFQSGNSPILHLTKFL